MNVKFSVRKANLNDIARLTELYRLLLLHEQSFGSFHFCTEGMIAARSEFHRNIINTGEGFILVLELGGNIEGMLVAQYAAGETGHPVQKPVFIQDTYVMPEYQKTGAGTFLFDEALKLCKKDRRSAIHIWIAPENAFLNKKMERDYGFRTVYNIKSVKI